jgi:hypothetical protein
VFALSGITELWALRRQIIATISSSSILDRSLLMALVDVGDSLYNAAKSVLEH